MSVDMMDLIDGNPRTKLMTKTTSLFVAKQESVPNWIQIQNFNFELTIWLYIYGSRFRVRHHWLNVEILSVWLNLKNGEYQKSATI